MFVESLAADLNTTPVVLSVQALSAIVAQPLQPALMSPSDAAPAAIMINGQTLPATTQGISVTSTNTGQGSTSQAAVSISFTMALPSAAKPGR